MLPKDVDELCADEAAAANHYDLHMFIYNCYFFTIWSCSSPSLIVSLPTSKDPSIYSDVLAGYERGTLQIEHRFDNIRNFTYLSQRVKLCQLRMISLS